MYKEGEWLRLPGWVDRIWPTGRPAMAVGVLCRSNTRNSRNSSNSSRRDPTLRYPTLPLEDLPRRPRRCGSDFIGKRT